MRHEPAQALAFVGQCEHAQSQGGAGERAADDMHGSSGSRTELLGDIAAHAVVCGGGCSEHGHAGRQRRNQRADTAVVRAEVVAPVRDAVRLVNHEQAQAWREKR